MKASVFDILSESISALDRPAITRFAPSPTGFLHFGHVLSAIYVWGIGRLFNIKINLRIEDHDQSRSRQQYTDSILEDLQWLGLYPDNTVQRSLLTIPSSYVQSNNEQRYLSALQTLHERKLVYACSCTRKEIQAAAAEQVSLDELYYTGICRHKELSFTSNVGLRVLIPNDEVSFQDLYAGWQFQTPATQCGDVLLRDRHRHWTYQFAVVNDDLAEHVNVIIRGQDLLPSTGRQMLLRRLLLSSDSPPSATTFFHHPLLKGADGRKLSKRHYSEAISKLRQQGVSATEVLGQACHLGGLLAVTRAVDSQELPTLVKQHLKGIMHERA